MKYQVLISDVRVFKITVQASNLEAANELADAALEAGYEEHGELADKAAEYLLKKQTKPIDSKV